MTAVAELSFIDLRVQYTDQLALRCHRETVKGNIIAVIGHNGAGKSTLIKTALNLIEPSSGKIRVSFARGSEQLTLRPEQHMAFCPETGAVFSDISVEEYIRLWCRIKHRDPMYYRREGAAIVETLDVPPLMKKLGRELSKGQRRRVQTAIGFITNPKLFLFDEPFDGLDVQRTQQLAELIQEYSSNTSFIVSSHRMDVVERLADIILVLREGEFFALGPVEEVTRKMAGTTALLTLSGSLDEAIVLLQQRFPKYVVTRVGNQIGVTGPDWSDRTLVETISPLKVDAHVEHGRTSLVDAMSYHLRNGGMRSS